jgi:hypothetical protein
MERLEGGSAVPERLRGGIVAPGKCHGSTWHQAVVGRAAAHKLEIARHSEVRRGWKEDHTLAGERCLLWMAPALQGVI